MKKVLIYLTVAGLVSSCIVQGLTNDYKKLTESQKKSVLDLETFYDVRQGFIYKVNGQQLKAELKNHNRSIVYIFSNGCSSEFCKPLVFYENYARDNNYKLFMVMNGYTNLDATIKQAISNPLFVIDNFYYDEKISYKYTRYFENELTGNPLKEKN